MSSHGGNKAIIAALSANLGIAVTKFVAYLLTHSSSMLAESIHSVADSGNQVLLLIGGKRSRRAADEEHPFGYGRARYLYAFVVSIVLFSLGGLFALYEAWHKWADPHGIEGRWWWVPLAVLVVAIGMEGYSFRTAIHEANPQRGGQSWTRFIKSSKAPELPVVLLEDFGALIGLVLALGGVGMTLVTGNGRWDAAGTAAIGVLLVAIAVILAVETKSLLLGESATPGDVAKIRAALVGPGVEQVIHLKTMHLGPEELLVGAKIAVHGTDSARQVAQAIDAAEQRVRAAVPIARVIYLEPDIRDVANR
ncbi:cation diffusion facilitator family transporter [Rarobacter incanus]|uniref:Cation diffusion facilitator family transporter n=1 Tax=Rarobacter incanus TaxID=153494 RepID=A0A542SRT5_9MICO|nr:cation diffusion facilitator family transporter [Rarobacter incanus]TQK77304.1 cation diffusion facilitator family transporter [Rarobacter incanus]